MYSVVITVNNTAYLKVAGRVDPERSHYKQNIFITAYGDGC